MNCADDVSARSPASGSRPVLVVEDDPAARELFRTTLRAEGYAVIAVENGLAALRHLEHTVPAAVVLDLGLPLVGGTDVHHEMAARGWSATVPIILVTGSCEPINEADYSCVLRKPVDPTDLVTAVARCLRNRQPGG